MLVEAIVVEQAMQVKRAIVEAAIVVEQATQVKRATVEAAIVVEQAMQVKRAIVEAASGFDHKHEGRPGQTPEQAPHQTTSMV